MLRPKLEIADVIRHHGAEFLRSSTFSPRDASVLKHLAACRTAELGGHVERCAKCGYERNSYNSCRDRHCPKCQVSGAAQWVEAREQDLLPVPYFHVVFTLPEEIAPIALQNKGFVYGLLFRTAASVLTEVAADPRHLGAQLGFLGVLHTWGQTLVHHPHVHFVIAGGGPTIDGDRWVSCRRSFFLPVGVLREKFKGRFLDLLKRAHESEDLNFSGKLAHLQDRNRFLAYLKQPYAKKWVVYTKAPFGGPKQVLKYLARYTHRVAISNSRLIALEGEEVRFRWRDYRSGNQNREMSLTGTEFLRRFLLHVLPNGFVRIRYYGFLSNRARGTELPRCRKLLGVLEKQSESKTETVSEAEDPTEAGPDETAICPNCGKARMRRVNVILPQRADPWDRLGSP